MGEAFVAHPRKEEAMKILQMTDEEKVENGFPTSRRDIGDLFGVSDVTIGRWMRGRNSPLPKNTKKHHVNTEEEDLADIHDALMHMVTVKKNSQAAKILLQWKGQLIEKQETTLKFDGGDYAEARAQAKRELEAESYRIGKVRDEPTVLGKKLRISTGQGSREDNKV